MSNPPHHRMIEAPRRTATQWDAWLRAWPVAPTRLCDLLSAQQRLVVVAPHPDDEVLACGASLHDHAAEGGECLVVGVTDGEASHANTPGHDPLELAQIRRLESTEGLQQLGVGFAHIVRLGLPDGDLAERTGELASRLAGLLRASDVVISTWRKDGHPDHEACGHAAADACAMQGATLLEAPVWMWHWAVPGDSQVDWSRLRALAVESATVTRKLGALKAHQTQHTARPGGGTPVLDAAILERAAWHTEYFFIP